MQDIRILEQCPHCGEHLTLMNSINVETQETWLVKRCLKCAKYFKDGQVEQIIRIIE